MKRTGAQVDGNQARIVEALRKAGATVEPTHAVGKGFPDLVVGYRGATFLIEVKNPEQAPSAQKLTPPQVHFHDTWRGHVAIVRTIPEALEAIGITYRGTIQ